MYKFDPVTLALRDKNNRKTHIYYLKHTMEQAVILREIVEQARSLNPLDSASYSACKVPIPLEVVAPNQIVTRVYTRRPKVPKFVQHNKSKVAKSVTANKMEPDTSRGSDTLVAPTSSSSLIDCRKPDLSYLHVFGALCYPNNDSENLGKLQAIANMGLIPNPPPIAPFVPPSRHEWDLVFQLVFDEFFFPPASVSSLVPVEEALAPVESTGLLSSTTIDQDAPSPILETVFEESSSSDVIPTTMHSDAPISEHLNVDHAGCQDTRSSTSGSMQLLRDRLVSWLSKSQKIIAISSMKAEYITLFSYCVEVLWMRSQLTDNGLGFNKIPICHFIKEKVENRVVELYFVSTEYQLADIFTKALCQERIEFLIDKLEMRSFTPKTLKELADEAKE
nr:retrovirus-related Pol polyprotein from transposon TNT 1-94 [Tanacetum cinerariifolium]